MEDRTDFDGSRSWNSSGLKRDQVSGPSTTEEAKKINCPTEKTQKNNNTATGVYQCNNLVLIDREQKA